VLLSLSLDVSIVIYVVAALGFRLGEPLGVEGGSRSLGPRSFTKGPDVLTGCAYKPI
jgi:hypothetical protein